MNSIEICNLALAYIGNTRSIASMAEQSKEAILCSRFYNMTRETMLKSYPWNFAVKSLALTFTTETEDKFGFVYEYPEDCLRVLQVGSDDDPADFAIRAIDDDGTITRRIVCDLESAKAFYIADSQDTDAMPAEFVDALALALAVRLAGPMASDGRIVQSVQQQYQYAMMLAKQICAMEQKRPPITEQKYNNARW